MAPLHNITLQSYSLNVPSSHHFPSRVVNSSQRKQRVNRIHLLLLVLVFSYFDSTQTPLDPSPSGMIGVCLNERAYSVESTLQIISLNLFLPPFYYPSHLHQNFPDTTASTYSSPLSFVFHISEQIFSFYTLFTDTHTDKFYLLLLLEIVVWISCLMVF